MQMSEHVSVCKILHDKKKKKREEEISTHGRIIRSWDKDHKKRDQVWNKVVWVLPH